MGEGISIWAVYANPSDFPNCFAARRFDNDCPTQDLIVARTIEEVRDRLPPGLVRLERDPEDDPSIVEVWI